MKDDMTFTINSQAKSYTLHVGTTAIDLDGLGFSAELSTTVVHCLDKFVTIAKRCNGVVCDNNTISLSEFIHVIRENNVQRVKDVRCSVFLSPFSTVEGCTRCRHTLKNLLENCKRKKVNFKKN